MADLMSPDAPDLGIVDIESLLSASALAFSGERKFPYLIGGREVVFTYTLDADSSSLLGVRQRAGAERVVEDPENVAAIIVVVGELFHAGEFIFRETGKLPLEIGEIGGVATEQGAH